MTNSKKLVDGVADARPSMRVGKPPIKADGRTLIVPHYVDIIPDPDLISIKDGLNTLLVRNSNVLYVPINQEEINRLVEAVRHIGYAEKDMSLKENLAVNLGMLRGKVSKVAFQAINSLKDEHDISDLFNIISLLNSDLFEIFLALSMNKGIIMQISRLPSGEIFATHEIRKDEGKFIQVSTSNLSISMHLPETTKLKQVSPVRREFSFMEFSPLNREQKSELRHNRSLKKTYIKTFNNKMIELGSFRRAFVVDLGNIHDYRMVLTGFSMFLKLLSTDYNFSEKLIKTLGTTKR